jgi:hypothetical protein
MHFQQKNNWFAKSKGATIIEIDYLDEISKLGEDEFEVMQWVQSRTEQLLKFF